MKVIDSWDIQSNFWKTNPQFKLKETFKDFYNEDKSKEKQDSSLIMWGLAFLCDFDSKYKQLSDRERKELIAQDLFRNKEFNWEDEGIKHLIKAWEVFKSSAQKQMMQWERFLNEKTDFMQTMKYDENTAELIEKLLLSNTKLYKEYDEIMTRLSQETDGGTMIGGSMESLSEKGEI